MAAARGVSAKGKATAPLRGRWLVGLHERGGRLKRRQDMPAEAFWSAAELRRLAEQLGDGFGVLFVALSYRWLSRQHPDPDAFHLAIVAAVAKLYLSLAGDPFDWKKSPLLRAFKSAGLDEPADFALFWDFGSLHQPPRLGSDDRLFKAGLRASNIWYGHAHSVCWMQSELPEGFAGAAYDVSGWCFVEAAISACVKSGANRLDLGKRTKEAMDFVSSLLRVEPGKRLSAANALTRAFSASP